MFLRVWVDGSIVEDWNGGPISGSCGARDFTDARTRAVGGIDIWVSARPLRSKDIGLGIRATCRRTWVALISWALKFWKSSNLLSLGKIYCISFKKKKKIKILYIIEYFRKKNILVIMRGKINNLNLRKKKEFIKLFIKYWVFYLSLNLYGFSNLFSELLILINYLFNL